MKTCTWSLINIHMKQSLWQNSLNFQFAIQIMMTCMFSQIWMQSYDVQRELAALDEVRHGNPQRAKSFDRVSIGIPTNLPIWGGPSVWRQWSKVLLQIHTVHLRGIGGTHSVFNNWCFFCRYMKTRCPAWCDRVLISHDAKDNVLIQPRHALWHIKDIIKVSKTDISP